jgi:hypothetical protein
MAHRHTTTTTTTRTTRPRRSIFGRKKVVHHKKRKPKQGDKVAGAMKKIKGTILGHPGEKVSYPHLPRSLIHGGCGANETQSRLPVHAVCTAPMAAGRSVGLRDSYRWRWDG